MSRAETWQRYVDEFVYNCDVSVQTAICRRRHTQNVSENELWMKFEGESTEIYLSTPSRPVADASRGRGIK